MYNKNLFISSAFVAILTFCFVACNDKDNVVDSIPPTIKVSEPELGDSLKPGTELHFDADFVDDVMLKNCKVDIHWAEGHDHSKAVDEILWVSQKVFDLNGYKNKHLHEHFDIPTNAKEGKYHLVVYCADEAGNESQAFVSFVVSMQAREHTD